MMPGLEDIAERLLPFLEAAEADGTLNAEEDAFLHGLMGRFMFGGAISEEDLRLADLIMRRGEG